MKITVEFETPEEFEEWIAFRAWRKKHVVGKTPLRDSGLDRKTIDTLLGQNIEFAEDAQAMSDNDLLMIPTFGRKSLIAIREWRAS